MKKHLLAHFVLAATSLGAALFIISGVVTASMSAIFGAWVLMFAGLMIWQELRRVRQQRHRASMRTGGNNLFHIVDYKLPQR